MGVDGSGVFGGDWAETFEGPAVKVVDCGEVEEAVEVDYSGVGGCGHAVIGLNVSFVQETGALPR